MQKIWAHMAAGHVSLIYSVCWTPWLLFAERQHSLKKSSKFWIVAPAAILAIHLAADVRWAAVAALFWAAYQFAQRSKDVSWSENYSRLRVLITWMMGGLGRVVGVILLAGLLAAPFLTPMLEYVRLSTRASLSSSEALSLSLPPERLLGLLVPDPGGYAEWIIYPTAVGMIFMVLGITSVKLIQRVRFWIAVSAIAMIYSLGSSIPGLELITRLPILNLLRVPPRAIFVVGISIAVVAAYAVDGLLSSSPAEFRIGRLRPILFLIIILELLVLLTAAVWWQKGSLPFPGVWSTAWAVVTVTLVLLRMWSKISPRVFWVGMMLAVLIEPAVLSRLSFEPRSVSQVYGEAGQAAAYIKIQPGLFRVYSPSYSIPQQVGVIYGLQSTDGVDPMQLAAYADFMVDASGVPNPVYSVTVPAFSNGEPKTDNRYFSPDPMRLGWLNVRYVISEFEVNRSGLELMARFGETRIYENEFFYPRAWIQSTGNVVSTITRPAQILVWQPNRVLLQPQGPGWLVLSEMDYPGWEVHVDGQPGKIEKISGIFRSVKLDPGFHRVEFTFRPQSILLGAFLSFLACLGIFAYMIIKKDSEAG